MGERGVAPEPTYLKKLKGNPGKRNLNLVEPTPKKIEWEAPPEYFDSVRCKVWDNLCKELATLDILATCDKGVLERYVEFFVQWRECRDYIESNLKGKFSYAVRGPSRPEIREVNGNLVSPAQPGAVRYLKPYSEYKTLMELSGQLLRIEDRFGLSPSARTRLAAEGETPYGDDGDDDFGDLDD